MAAVMKFICIAILCSLILGGDCQLCSSNNLSIEQSATGKIVHDKSEWSVTITNNCRCAQLSVKLDCDGFQTVEPIDPSILSIPGSVCLVNQPISGNGKFSFIYAWDNSFPFSVLFSQVDCS